MHNSAKPFEYDSLNFTAESLLLVYGEYLSIAMKVMTNSSEIFKKMTPNGAFWLFVVFMTFFVYRMDMVAFEKPYGMHQWRQCDAYSMALNYYQEGRSLFDPAIHFLHGDDSGRAAGEFTGSYWLNAKLWKLVGFYPWTMRWMHMLIWLVGCWCLFALGRSWTSTRSSLGVVWLVMISPLMVFYGPNYLVNVSALAFVFMSWFLANALIQAPSASFRLRCMLFLTLALSILFRPTMIIGWIPILFAAWIFGDRKKWFWRFLFPFLLGMAWVFWTKYFNAKSQSPYFLTSIRPIWEVDDVGRIWKAFREEMVPHWYHRFILIGGALVLLVSVIGNFMNQSTPTDHQSAWLAWRKALFPMVLALICYTLLWFGNLDVHDYYLIEYQLVVPIFGWWMFSARLKGIGLAGTYKQVFTWLMMLVLLFQSIEARLRTEMKYMAPVGLFDKWVIPQRERDLWSWFHWDQQHRFGDFAKVEGELRNLGYSRYDRVISVPDPSPNITLSFLDQMGFTDLYDDHLQGDERIDWFVERGAVLLICNDPKWLESHQDSRWLKNQIASVGNTSIFDLSNSTSPLPPPIPGP